VSIDALVADLHRDKRPLLTAAGERRLAGRIQAGGSDGDAAARELVERNLRWAIRVAMPFRGCGLDFGELVNASAIGLMSAARRFDPDRGRFTTLATWWCRHELHNAMRSTSRAIRLPGDVYAQHRRVKRAEARLLTESSDSVTAERLAAATGLTPERVTELQALAPEPASLNRPVSDEDGAAEFGDLLPDRHAPAPLDVAADTLRSEALARALGDLPYRERRVLIGRFGLEGDHIRTLDELAGTLNVTRERVRQIELGAVARLAEQLSSDALRDEAAA
jgi:RNA polymerase primary sigma factor